MSGANYPIDHEPNGTNLLATTQWRRLTTDNNLLLARYLQVLYEKGAVVTELTFVEGNERLRLEPRQLTGFQTGLCDNGDFQIQGRYPEGFPIDAVNLVLPLGEGMFATEEGGVVKLRLPVSTVFGSADQVLLFERPG